MFQKIGYTLPDAVPLPKRRARIEEPSNAGTEEVSAKVVELKTSVQILRRDRRTFGKLHLRRVPYNS